MGRHFLSIKWLVLSWLLWPGWRASSQNHSSEEQDDSSGFLLNGIVSREEACIEGFFHTGVGFSFRCSGMPQLPACDKKSRWSSLLKYWEPSFIIWGGLCNQYSSIVMILLDLGAYIKVGCCHIECGNIKPMRPPHPPPFVMIIAHAFIVKPRNEPLEFYCLHSKRYKLQPYVHELSDNNYILDLHFMGVRPYEICPKWTNKPL